MIQQTIQAILTRHALVPLPMLSRLVATAVAGRNLALCFHRASVQRRVGEMQPELSMEARELDRLLDLLLATRPRGARWLTVTFDDGYADAVDYVQSRCRRYPDVEWLVFVCPEKIKKRAGYRWDLVEHQGGNRDRDIPLALEHNLDVRGENDRAELQSLGDLEAFRLATVEALRALAREPNVELGNHTNSHFRHAKISIQDSRYDIETSFRDFESMFGKTTQFAFPFGLPNVEFTDANVAIAREFGYSTIWSTQPCPYSERDRASGAILSRYPMISNWPAEKIALYIVLFAARHEAKRLVGKRPSWMVSAHDTNR